MKKFNELDKSQQDLVLKMISDLKEESIIKLYDTIANLTNHTNKNGIEYIKSLAAQPMCSVHTLFEIFNEYTDNFYGLQECFTEIRKYIGMEINIFILVNVMNSK